MNYTSTTGSSVHQMLCLILSDLLAQNAKLIATLSKGGDLHSINNKPTTNYTSTTGSPVHQTVCLILSNHLAQKAKLIATLSKGGNDETKGKEGNGSNNSNQGKDKRAKTKNREPKIMTQHYANGFVKIHHHIHQRKLLYTIIGPHWLAKLNPLTDASRLPCHPIMSTRIARYGGVDAHPMSAQHIASTHSWHNTICAWAY